MKRKIRMYDYFMLFKLFPDDDTDASRKFVLKMCVGNANGYPGTPSDQPI